MPPEFYDPERVGDLYRPDINAAIEAGSSAGLAPSSEDSRRIMLVLVDVQVDFVHPEGALSVPGAVEDTRRTIEWLYQHAAQLTTIGASLDSHLPIQIFSPTWWVDADGTHPDPFTVITGKDVQSGKWRPVYEPEWSMAYVGKLEAQAKKELMIWPYHTLIGTQGHTLMPALYEAIAYHSAARQAQPNMLIKGSIPKTEHYSILEPEVKVPEHPQGRLNTEFLDLVAQHDLVYIAGQAKSHCVLETVTSMMRYFQAEKPAVVGNLRLLTDCTSAVAHPEIDFDALADEALADFARRGLHLVEARDPLGQA
jgi:nicotinamidase-related amidase